MGPLTKDLMIAALNRLDEKLVEIDFHPVHLIVGGGGAMILAHHFPMGTTDIDAIPKGGEVPELSPLCMAIASEQKLPLDWLNPYFSTFIHVLPKDYGNRLVEIFKGQRLSAQALGREDMLIMKCFAHRRKDVGHARALVRQGVDHRLIENHLEFLKQQKIPLITEALQFYDEILEMEEE